MKYEIYCINLIDRVDRYNQAKYMFKKAGIKNVNFHRTTKSSKGGKYGCFESHYNILDKSSADIIIVFEDDIYLNKCKYMNWQFVLDNIKKCFDDGFTYFSIANIPTMKKPKSYNNKTMGCGCKNIVVSKFFCGLGYAIKKSEFLRIKDDMYAAMNCQHVDIFYYINIDKQVGLRKPFFCQNLMDSDNNWSTFVPSLDIIPRKIISTYYVYMRCKKTENIDSANNRNDKSFLRYLTFHFIYHNFLFHRTMHFLVDLMFKIYYYYTFLAYRAKCSCFVGYAS